MDLFFLKSLDMNSFPIKLYQANHSNKNKRKKFEIYKGSRFGGFLTIISFLIVVTYFLILVKEMYGANNDLTSSKKLVYDYEKTPVRYWSNYTLLPSMEIKPNGH